MSAWRGTARPYLVRPGSEGGAVPSTPQRSAPRAFLTSSSYRPCVYVRVWACACRRVCPPQGVREGGERAAGGARALGGSPAGAGGAAYLPVLLQVVVEDLRVGLLMRGQDVHERGRGVRRRRRGVDGTAAAQRRRQVEGGCRGSSVKSLLLEGLLRRRCQRRGEGREPGSAPLPLPGSAPLPSSTRCGPGSQRAVRGADRVSAYGSFWAWNCSRLGKAERFPSPWLGAPRGGDLTAQGGRLRAALPLPSKAAPSRSTAQTLTWVLE